MALDPIFVSGNGHGVGTASANTAIQFLVPPRAGAYARLMQVQYVNGVTAHTITVLRALSQVKVVGVNAISQAVLNISADPGVLAGVGGAGGTGIATNDFLAWANDDGTYTFNKVSSVATLAITLASNLLKALVGGEKVWFFGALTRTNVYDGNAHPAYTAAASVTTTLSDPTNTGGFVAAFTPGTPLLVSSNNITNAGTMNVVQYAYTLQG
jgi:hypothetical protein